MKSNRKIIDKSIKNKQLIGKTIRDVKDKSVLVEVNQSKINSIYQKRYIISKKILVHVETEVKKGQFVTIEETRPISKKKSWKIVKVN